MTLSSEVFLCSLGAAIRALIGSLEWDRWAKYVFDSVTITNLFSQRGVGGAGGVGTATAARKAGDRKVDNDHAEHYHQQQQQQQQQQQKKKKRMMQKGKVSELDDKKSRYCEVDKEVDVDGDGDDDDDDVRDEEKEERSDDDDGGFSRLRAVDVHQKVDAFRAKLACVGLDGCASSQPQSQPQPQPQHEMDTEVDCPNVEERPWSVVLHNRTEAMVYTSWKSWHEGGPYNEYVSSTVLFGMNPVDVAMFIMDFRNRSKMDSNTLAYQFVRSGSRTAEDDDDDEDGMMTRRDTDHGGSRGARMLANETLCILTKFPMLLAPRRYVYERCSLAIGDEFYVVSSASHVPAHVRDTLPGAGQRVVDVDEFESVVCIRRARQYDGIDGHGGRGAVEVVMNYFENPKLQPALCNFAAQASMWRLALEFHRNFMRYTSMCNDSSLSHAIKQYNATQSSSPSSSPSSSVSSASPLSSSPSSSTLGDLYADGSVERLVKGVHAMIDDESDDEHGSDARLRKLQSRTTRRNRVVVAAGIVFVIGRSMISAQKERLMS